VFRFSGLPWAVALLSIALALPSLFADFLRPQSGFPIR